MKIEVDAAKFCYQFVQILRRCLVVNVNLTVRHDAVRLTHSLCKALHTSSCHAHLISSLRKETRHLQSDAGRGSHYYCFLHCLVCLHYIL